MDITQPEQLIEATKGIEAIYHLAAVSDVNIAFQNPLACVDINLRGTANVLEAARVNKLGRVIFASTIWVYQASTNPELSEAASFSPGISGHLYTTTKIAGEMLCHSYRQLYGVPITILRYGIPYGPFMRQSLLIPMFVKKVLAAEPLQVNGDGSQYRRFVYVEDLARGNVAALAAKAENQTYNLEGKEKVSVLDLTKALDHILGGVKIQFMPARPGDLAGVDVDAKKALADLGWQPLVSFDDGLRRTVAWLLSLSTDSASKPKQIKT